MGIRATRLSVRGYRSFEEFDLDLDPHVTVLVGRNAMGKTNLAEALQLLTSGMSFRKPTPTELLREGASFARLKLTLEGDGRSLEMGLTVEEGRRSFMRNGKRVGVAGVRGALPSVLFCPDDLDMVKRSAQARRHALDAFGMQLNETYAKLLGTYARTVEQRNNLLREGPAPALLEAWDESLVASGTRLLMHRRSLLERLRPHFIEAYGEIAPHEEADVVYESAVAPAGLPFEQVGERFRNALAARRADELRRGMTLVGPHRDEILFTIDGRAARDYGSQGQQRTIVLAWKFAEVQVTRDILGCYPLLLLDDVMSELDQRRRAAIMEFVAKDIQTLITTTNLGYFSHDILERAKVVCVGPAPEDI